MTPAPHGDVSRRLRNSRAELRALLGHGSEGGAAEADSGDEFPRSRTMRYLTGGRAAAGLLVIGAIALAMNPRLGAAILRKLPFEALVSRLLTKIV